jgi:hypothetical protein
MYSGRRITLFWKNPLSPSSPTNNNLQFYLHDLRFYILYSVATVTGTDTCSAYQLLSELWLSHNEADRLTFCVSQEMAMYNTGSAAELSGGQLTMGIIGCLPDNVQQVICMFLLSVALS